MAAVCNNHGASSKDILGHGIGIAMTTPGSVPSVCCHWSNPQAVDNKTEGFVTTNKLRDDSHIPLLLRTQEASTDCGVDSIVHILY